jgi:hypothetical protein
MHNYILRVFNPNGECIEVTPFESADVAIMVGEMSLEDRSGFYYRVELNDTA